MWTDGVSLGPAPAEEQCVQLGTPDYQARARRECEAYIEAIRKVCGPEPAGARLRVKRQDHDFGQYLDVVCEFDRNDRVAAEYAFQCDESAPTTWEAAGMTAPGSPPAGPTDRASGRTRDRGNSTFESHSPTDHPLPGKPIDLPLPPNVTEAFGYSGDSRFVGFYWSPCGDEVIYTDGRSLGTGQSWTFLLFRRHPAVAPLLAGWNLGHSDQDAEHCLILDQERNRASIAPVAEAQAFLAAQHPPMPELTPEETAVMRERIEQVLEEWRSRKVDPGEVQRLMDEQRGRVGRMMSFLDMCPVPGGTGQTP